MSKVMKRSEAYPVDMSVLDGIGPNGRSVLDDSLDFWMTPHPIMEKTTDETREAQVWADDMVRNGSIFHVGGGTIFKYLGMANYCPDGIFKMKTVDVVAWFRDEPERAELGKHALNALAYAVFRDYQGPAYNARMIACHYVKTCVEHLQHCEGRESRQLQEITDHLDDYLVGAVGDLEMGAMARGAVSVARARLDDAVHFAQKWDVDELFKAALEVNVASCAAEVMKGPMAEYNPEFPSSAWLYRCWRMSVLANALCISHTIQGHVEKRDNSLLTMLGVVRSMANPLGGDAEQSELMLEKLRTAGAERIFSEAARNLSTTCAAIRDQRESRKFFGV